MKIFNFKIYPGVILQSPVKQVKRGLGSQGKSGAGRPGSELTQYLLEIAKRRAGNMVHMSVEFCAQNVLKLTSILLGFQSFIRR